MRRVVRRVVVAGALVASVLTPVLGIAPGALASEHDDAGSGADAGNTFESATPVVPRGAYSGALRADLGDSDDFLKFFLAEGASLSVVVDVDATGEPAAILDPDGRTVDAGTSAFGEGIAGSNALTVSPLDLARAPLRLSVHRAVVAGEYRLHLQTLRTPVAAYQLCFVNCEGPTTGDIGAVFDGSLPSPRTTVLLVPPTHGDLGNPFGPTVTDYIDATLRGVRRWEPALQRFAADHPEFSYLNQIDVTIEVYDRLAPVDPAGYDVVIGYVTAGAAFRGVAADADPGFADSALRQFGLSGTAHFSGRVIALSLFGASPRAGQVLYDYPEVNDLEIVTMHEFGHTFGLGHTLHWDATLGPDLMNSPATFVYGDGWAAGDGGERTPLDCLSSLDLYGMAHLYRWLPTGRWQWTYGAVRLPAGMDYQWYC